MKIKTYLILVVAGLSSIPASLTLGMHSFSLEPGTYQIEGGARSTRLVDINGLHFSETIMVNGDLVLDDGFDVRRTFHFSSDEAIIATGYNVHRTNDNFRFTASTRFVGAVVTYNESQECFSIYQVRVKPHPTGSAYRLATLMGRPANTSFTFERLETGVDIIDVPSLRIRFGNEWVLIDESVPQQQRPAQEVAPIINLIAPIIDLPAAAAAAPAPAAAAAAATPATTTATAPHRETPRTVRPVRARPEAASGSGSYTQKQEEPDGGSASS